MRQRSPLVSRPARLREPRVPPMGGAGMSEKNLATADAVGAVARAFEEILGRRHPGVSFSVPDVRPQTEASPRPGKIIRPLAPPEHERALADRHAAAANEHGIEAGVK